MATRNWSTPKAASLWIIRSRSVSGMTRPVRSRTTRILSSPALRASDRLWRHRRKAASTCPPSPTIWILKMPGSARSTRIVTGPKSPSTTWGSRSTAARSAGSWGVAMFHLAAVTQPQFGRRFVVERARVKTRFAREDFAILDSLQPERLDVRDTHVFESLPAHGVDERVPLLRTQGRPPHFVDQQHGCRTPLLHLQHDRLPAG